MCGEHLQNAVTKAVAKGIIPACAGNTARFPSRTSNRRDHPRVCGEHGVLLAHPAFGLGSSPRVGGTPADVDKAALEAGIIPACAGNTLKNPSSKYHSD